MISNWARKVIPISILLCDEIISKPSVLWNIYTEEMKNSEIYAEIYPELIHKPSKYTRQTSTTRGQRRARNIQEGSTQDEWLSCIPSSVLLYLILDHFLQ